MALPRSSKKPRISIPIPKRRAFHNSPSHQRLGAATYAQEWQTGSYHYNKAHTKTLPVAAKHTDHLLTAWMTQKQRRAHPDAAVYNQLLRASITAQRRDTDAALVSNSIAKDFGDRVEVTAFVYDSVEAAKMELDKMRARFQGVKAEGGNKRGPQRRRRGPLRPGTGAAGGRAGGAGARGAGGRFGPAAAGRSPGGRPGGPSSAGSPPRRDPGAASGSRGAGSSGGRFAPRSSGPPATAPRR